MPVYVFAPDSTWAPVALLLIARDSPVADPSTSFDRSRNVSVSWRGTAIVSVLAVVPLLLPTMPVLKPPSERPIAIC